MFARVGQAVCRRGRPLFVATVAASSMGILLSIGLLQKQLGVEHLAVVDAICGQEAGGCATVGESRWAFFPPRRAERGSGRSGQSVHGGQPAQDGEPPAAAPALPDESWRMPVAALGLVYYCFMAAWLVLAGGDAQQRRWLYAPPVTAAVLATAASLGFIYLMATRIGAWCPLCMGAHALNFLLLGLILLAWMQGPRTERTAKPSYRLAVAAAAVGPLLAVGIWGWLERAVAEKERRELATRYAALQNDADVLAWLHYKQPRQKITLRDDDPVLPARGRPNMRVVIFTDFACPFCEEFERKLLQQYRPLFGNRLEVIYKHYPLCADCNPALSSNMHPSACKAAYLAEAARRQGGMEAFLTMARLLRRSSNPDFSAAGLRQWAQSADLDPDRVIEDFQSSSIRERVAEDVALAHSLKVRGTPTVYLDGRRLDVVAKNSLGFWKLAAGNLPGARPETRANSSQTTSPFAWTSPPTAEETPSRVSSSRSSRIVSSLFNHYDGNGDGVLTAAEWQPVARLSAHLDADRSGGLAPAEVLHGITHAH